MEAAKDAHAICVLTEWDEFKTYDYQKVRHHGARAWTSAGAGSPRGGLRSIAFPLALPPPKPWSVRPRPPAWPQCLFAWRPGWLQVYDSMVKPAFIFDGRNILDHAKLRCVACLAEAVGMHNQPMAGGALRSHMLWAATMSEPPIANPLLACVQGDWLHCVRHRQASGPLPAKAVLILRRKLLT